MRKRVIISLLVVVFLNVQIVNSWKVWGMVLPSGSEIQVYWYSKIGEKDYRIPQDLEVLELDEFTVWFRFSQTNEINFTVQLYSSNVYERIKIDPDTNETYTTNVKVYDKDGDLIREISLGKEYVKPKEIKIFRGFLPTKGLSLENYTVYTVIDYKTDTAEGSSVIKIAPPTGLAIKFDEEVFTPLLFIIIIVIFVISIIIYRKVK